MVHSGIQKKKKKKHFNLNILHEACKLNVQQSTPINFFTAKKVCHRSHGNFLGVC